MFALIKKQSQDGQLTFWVRVYDMYLQRKGLTVDLMLAGTVKMKLFGFVLLALKGHKITRLKILLNRMTVVDFADEAAALVGGHLSADDVARAAELAAAVSRPRTDHRGSAAYKRHIIATFVTRILATLPRTEQEVA